MNKPRSALEIGAVSDELGGDAAAGLALAATGVRDIKAGDY